MSRETAGRHATRVEVQEALAQLADALDSVPHDFPIHEVKLTFLGGRFAIGAGFGHSGCPRCRSVEGLDLGRFS